MNAAPPTLVLLLAAGAAAQQPAAASPLPLPADWAQRDLEGKWVAYRADVDARPQDTERQKRWAEQLGAQRGFELLEWIGLYEGWRVAGPVLRGADAPATFRVALWNLAAVDSHNKDNASKALLQGGGPALGWFERHPEARRGRGAAIYEQLLQSGVAAADPGPMLPPLDPVQFLAPQLDVPAELAAFGDRKTAEPRVRYVHQVLRALQGVLVWGEADAMHAHKILALLRHRDTAVRGAAARTIAALPPDLVPWLPLLKLVDGDGNADDRRLAAIALARSSHPRAFFELHRLAADAAHPAAAVALAKLGDLPDPWSAERLRELAAADPARARDYGTAAQKIEGALAATDLAATPQLVRALLLRVAWLRATNDARADLAAAATTTLLRQRLGSNLGAVVATALAAEGPDPLGGDERSGVQAALRILEQELRAAGR